MRRFLVLAACGTAALGAGSVHAKPPADPTNADRPAPACIARNTSDLRPTLRAPEWYVPGWTPPCSPSRDKGARLLTAGWVFYVYANAWRWRTTPQNADYSAKDCETSYSTCGAKIIHDAPYFHATCVAYGLTKYEVARNIRYWADRARANGDRWRVFTFSEAGGNPYSCRFSVTFI